MRSLQMPKRAGEFWNPAPRTDRFLKLENRWYVKVRGKRLKGPFPSIYAARAGLRALKSPRMPSTWING